MQKWENLNTKNVKRGHRRLRSILTLYRLSEKKFETSLHIYSYSCFFHIEKI